MCRGDIYIQVVIQDKRNNDLVCVLMLSALLVTFGPQKAQVFSYSSGHQAADLQSIFNSPFFNRDQAGDAGRQKTTASVQTC